MKKIIIVSVILALLMVGDAFAVRGYVGNFVQKGVNGYDVTAYGAKGDGSTNDASAFGTAVAAAASGKLIIPSSGNNYVIGTNTTISDGVDLVIKNGAVLEISNGVTLTINGSLDAGVYQIFDTSPGGTVSIASGACEAVLPQWWGASGDGATSCHDAFEAAITAAQSIGRCYIPSGTYIIEDEIDQCWPNDSTVVNGLVVEGAGKNDTILYFTDTEGYCLKVTAATVLDANFPVAGTIKDLQIQCPNIPAVDDGGAILLNSSFFLVKDVTFFNSTTATAVTSRGRWIPQSGSVVTNDSNGDFTTTGAGATEKYAIKFTTQSRAQFIHDVTVRLGKTGAPAGTIHAEIWSDSAGSPNAIINAASDTVTNTTLSAVADGADQQFTWSNSGDRPAVVASTAYWLVLATTGYTYTDGVTEVRLRYDADGGTSEVASFTFGGAWSVDADDGANYSVTVIFGQPLGNRIVDCYAQTPTTLGRAVKAEDTSVLFVTGCDFYTIDGIIFDATVLLMSDNFIYAADEVLDIKCSNATLTNCYIEGPTSYFGSKGGTASAIVNIWGGLLRSNITWEPGIQFNDYGLDGFRYGTDDPAMVPHRFENLTITAGTPLWIAGEHTKDVVDADALDGTCLQLTGYVWKASIKWSSMAGSGFYGRLPRGTYLVTYWAKDTNQVANDAALVSLYDDDTLKTSSLVTVTLTADYRPYYILHRITADMVSDDDTWESRVQLYKNSSTANTISVSHATIEYLGPDRLNDRNMTLFSNDLADTDGAREVGVNFLGQQSGKEPSFMAQIKASHDGAADDEKGVLEFLVNDGNDKFSPTLAGYFDSLKEFYLSAGAGITEFSTDGTMGGNSDDAVPTEAAVVTYVAAQIAGASGGADPQPVGVVKFIPTGDGSANDVLTNRQADGTNRRTFCRTTGGADTQDMDWYAETMLAQAIPATKDITIYVRASDYANGVMTMTVVDQAGNADATGPVVITPSANDTWQAKTYSLTSTYTEDEVVWIKIAITSLDTADTVDFASCSIDL